MEHQNFDHFILFHLFSHSEIYTAASSACIYSLASRGGQRTLEHNVFQQEEIKERKQRKEQKKKKRKIEGEGVNEQLLTANQPRVSQG